MSSPTLTDEQVTRVLAERDGFTEVYDWRPGFGTYKDRGCHARIPPYLTSRDALAPVLEGLTVDEQCELDTLIWDKMWRKQGPLLRSATWLLTMPARDLAHAVAAVLGQDKEGSK